MTDKEHARKYANESISLAISMYNPKAEDIAFFACLYGLTYKNDEIQELKKKNKRLESDFRICEKNADTYYDRLTKAEELLRRFIKWARTENCEKFDVILADAEQFLKEIEK